MRIASGHNEKTFYGLLNEVAGGHLYEKIQEVATEPLPRNYAMFKEGQRQRVGAARVADQFKWTMDKEDRQAKPGLGESIIKYLEIVELEAAPEQAAALAEIIPQRLGTIVTRIMQGMQREQELQTPAAPPAPPAHEPEAQPARISQFTPDTNFMS
jgi:hypothetical protein